MASLPLPAYVADTHSLIWYLTASPRLGKEAKSAFDRVAAGQARLIACEAKLRGAKLITCDGEIRKSQVVETVW